LVPVSLDAAARAADAPDEVGEMLLIWTADAGGV